MNLLGARFTPGAVRSFFVSCFSFLLRSSAAKPHAVLVMQDLFQVGGGVSRVAGGVHHLGAGSA